MVGDTANEQRRVHLWTPILVGALLSCVMTWPLVWHLGGDIPAEWGDPFFDVWQVAWIGHALLHQPLDLFQSNRFWPDADTLAYNDVMLGYGPAGLLAAQGPHAALIVHNLLILFAYALAFVGAYLLAHELGARWPGAFVAGAAFAYAPWRVSQVRHLNVLSSGGIALALFLLVRGYRTGSGRTVLAGWLVAAWQVTLGFSLGIQFGYLLLLLGVIAGIYWLRDGRPGIARGVVLASVTGVVCLAAVAILLSRPYLRVIDAHPEAERTANTVAFFSPPPRSFLTAAPENVVWGDATAERRDTLRWPIEQTLFPGVAIVLLALLGLWSRVYPGGLRIGLACGVAVTGVLSLGLPNYPDAGRGYTPYRLLYDLAPGWDSIRTPSRLNTLTSLGLALLAGAGTCLVIRAVSRSSIPRRVHAQPRVATIAVATVLAGLVLVEGFGRIPHWPAPSVPAAQARAPDPQLHLPIDWAPDLVYGYWSTDGFPRIMNGVGSFAPTGLSQARRKTLTFPDGGSVDYLRRLGVRTVVLHPGLTYGTAWAGAAGKPVAGLPLVREVIEDTVLYHLEPLEG